MRHWLANVMFSAISVIDQCSFVSCLMSRVKPSLTSDPKAVIQYSVFDVQNFLLKHHSHTMLVLKEVTKLPEHEIVPRLENEPSKSSAFSRDYSMPYLRKNWSISLSNSSFWGETQLNFSCFICVHLVEVLLSSHQLSLFCFTNVTIGFTLASCWIRALCRIKLLPVTCFGGHMDVNC